MIHSRVLFLFVSLSLIFSLISQTGCESALKPEQTPNRVVINFLKDVGRYNYTGAQAFVAPDQHDRIPTWASQLIFPEISNPPTPEEAEKIDKFIGTIYRITSMDETDTSAKIYVVFTASDALMGFPSVADNPLTPVSATWTVMLTRTMDGEGTEAEFGDWLITSIESGAN
jgi:hypothetical protein